MNMKNWVSSFQKRFDAREWEYLQVHTARITLQLQDPETGEIHVHNLGYDAPERKVKIEVRETISGREELPKGLHMGACECGDASKFGCYPEDDICYCGVSKHHVHCANCNGVSQIG